MQEIFKLFMKTQKHINKITMFNGLARIVWFRMFR